jgi:hypothetical protein
MLITIAKENLHANTNSECRTFCGDSRPNYFISPDFNQAPHASSKGSNARNNKASGI